MSLKKWAYGIKGKVKIAAVLGGVLSLLLWSNLMDRKRVTQLQTSFSAIYEDRLMVEGFIFDLSSILHEREQLVISSLNSHQLNAATSAHLKALDVKMSSLVEDYASTQFTDLEKRVFLEFKELVPSISQIGYDLKDNSLAETNKTLTHKGLAKLTVLSNIQTSEGQRLWEETNGIMLQKQSSSQFEIISLIALAIMIQVLLFSSTSVFKKIQQKPHLN
ncbi:MCP four helix bundle domain-containing protein [uncultured Arcticibacterium sp.]|uniref:MCP four helix bundle domain-containing protein n=1 Tax=uncultured Arcticibacterium sp. TaxID=2173042 RepID=UPI0030FC0AD3